MRNRKRVWIAWETQRRSLNLSVKVNATRAIFDDEDKGLIRYPLSAVKTFLVLWKHRGQLVFVQFPSLFLAVAACFFKPLLRYTLVVDRHTDFSLELKPPYSLKERMILLLAAYTVRKADLTVVTNAEMAAGIDAAGGWSFVLPDPYPDLPTAPQKAHEGPTEILFVSTWAVDEPVLETIEACRALQNQVKIYISGRMKKHFEKAVATAPSNFIPTGFLSDGDYFKLMAQVDCVMAVTTRPSTLVCGGYEAVSMGKPMILGNSKVLREYFCRGALYTDGSSADLIRALRELPEKLPALRREILQFQEQSRKDWEGRLIDLNRVLEKEGIPR